MLVRRKIPASGRFKGVWGPGNTGIGKNENVGTPENSGIRTIITGVWGPENSGTGKNDNVWTPENAGIGV
jgi:hypothetical protein